MYPPKHVIEDGFQKVRSDHVYQQAYGFRPVFKQALSVTVALNANELPLTPPTPVCVSVYIMFKYIMENVAHRRQSESVVKGEAVGNNLHQGV